MIFLVVEELFDQLERLPALLVEALILLDGHLILQHTIIILILEGEVLLRVLVEGVDEDNKQLSFAPRVEFEGVFEEDFELVLDV